MRYRCTENCQGAHTVLCQIGIMKSLVIIPAYNESDSIAWTVNQLKKDAPDFDYLVINDCSTDNTLEICRENGFPVLNLPVNLGIGGAVQTGYMYASVFGYDICVQLDGDGQHDAGFLNEMRDMLTDEGLDMVIGSRFIEKKGFQSTGARRTGIKYISRLLKRTTGVYISDPTSGMRMINRRTIELFAKNYPREYPEPESLAMIIRNGYKVGEKAVVMRCRQGGKSSISPLKSVYYMIRVSISIIMEKFRKADKTND